MGAPRNFAFSNGAVLDTPHVYVAPARLQLNHWALTVTQPRLYLLIRQPGPITDRTFEITFLDPEVQAYAFTFG